MSLTHVEFRVHKQKSETILGSAKFRETFFLKGYFLSSFQKNREILPTRPFNKVNAAIGKREYEMRDVAPSVQFIAVAACLVNDTETQTLSSPPKIDSSSHRAPGGVKNM